MRKPPDFFELCNKWLDEKETSLHHHKVPWLANSIFKGVGQILFCGSAVSGLLFLGGLAAGWWVIVPYCLGGCIVSTLTAFFLRQKRVLIGAGLFGYNGTLIGLTWPFFWPLSYFSIPLLILACGLSTLFSIALMGIMSNGRVNMPVVSIPFVVIFLAFLGSAYATGLVPVHPVEPVLSLSSLNLEDIHKRLVSLEEWHGLVEELFRHVVLVGLFFAGILFYSRIAALCAVMGMSLSLVVAFLLEGPEGLHQLGLHGFTSLPIAIALGGFFIAFNVPCFFYSLLATLLGIFLWLLIAPALAPYGIPVLTIVFNVVTLLFILPLKQPYVAMKIPWLFAVNLSRAVRPEETFRWYKLHRQAARYWDNVV